MKIARLTALFGFLFLPSVNYAQWSISTRAESTLYVCPGFYPGIVTFDDGSSIVLGALQSYIFARKIDERGYYIWTPPVQVFHNDSSFITDVQNVSIGDWGGWTSDGDGGVILFWYDHRGAYRDGQSGRWLNNAIYVQRVDRFGNLRWTSGGVKVQGAETGLKQGGIVSDGQGGCVLAWVDRGFDYPGSPNKVYITATRYNGNGTGMWRTVLDSSTQNSSFYYRDLSRAGALNYIGCYFFGGNATYTVDASGIRSTGSPWVESFSNVSWRDSVLFRLSGGSGLRLLKLGSSGDTLWNTPFSARGGCEGVVPFRKGGLTPDGIGGIYYLYSCQDTIYHFDSTGQFQRILFPAIGTIGGYVFSDRQRGLVLAGESGRGQRYQLTGEARWDTAYRYLTNAGNAEFRFYASDNKGGIIVVFWPLLNGIYVQHTGRDGRVGILTSVKEQASVPVRVELAQNYPNPFNPSTTIEFALPKDSQVSLKLYDLLGREVKSLLDAPLTAGYHRVTLDGSSLATGVYLYRMQAANFIAARKLLMMK